MSDNLSGPAIAKFFRDTLRNYMNPDVALAHRIAEAQQRYNMAKDGDAIQIDSDLFPYINRTET